MTPPAEVATVRTCLRRWAPSYAGALKAALDESAGHLLPWIPRAVAESAPVPQLESRLRGYAVSFDEGREWLYAMFRADDGTLVGGIGLHPRTARMRVPAPEADRVELGYWLRVAAVGQGLVTEAAQALLGLTPALPGRGHVEIRCDPRNVPSVAVARRLGFRHVGSVAHLHAADPDVPELMLWERRPPAADAPRTLRTRRTRRT